MVLERGGAIDRHVGPGVVAAARVGDAVRCTAKSTRAPRCRSRTGPRRTPGCRSSPGRSACCRRCPPARSTPWPRLVLPHSSSGQHSSPPSHGVVATPQLGASPPLPSLPAPPRPPLGAPAPLPGLPLPLLAPSPPTPALSPPVPSEAGSEPQPTRLAMESAVRATRAEVDMRWRIASDVPSQVRERRHPAAARRDARSPERPPRVRNRAWWCDAARRTARTLDLQKIRRFL